MKFFKIVLLGLIIVPLIFVICNKSEKPNLAGDWVAKQILINEKQIYPAEIDQYIETAYQVRIDDLSDSIFMYRDHISARYKRIKSHTDEEYFILSSKESALNGKFNLAIDTIHIGPRSYKVHLKLQSKKTIIYLQRTINIGPWKPEFPRKGQV
jgi:hypothetical protein